MAIQWGPIVNKCQIGLEYWMSPGTVTQNTTSVMLYCNIYFRTTTYVTDTNNTLTWSGYTSGSQSGINWDYQTGSEVMATANASIPLQYNTTQTKTLSATLNGIDYAGQNLTVSASFTIPARPNPSASISASATDVVMDTPVTITLSNITNGYTYSVWENTLNGYGGDVLINAVKSTSTSNMVVTWTPKSSNHAPGVPDADAGVWQLTADTVDNTGKYIGSTTLNMLLEVPSNANPTVGTVSVTDNVSAVSSTIGTYVKTLSQAKVTTAGEAGIYGSTIKKIEVALNGTYYDVTSTKTWTSGYLSQAGTNTIIKRVTDSRGNQSTVQTTINVLDYAAPKISSFIVPRADAAFALYSGGTNGQSSLTANVTSLVNGSEKNTLSYKIDYRQKGTTTWNNKVTFTAGAGIISYTNRTDNITGPFATDQVWEFLLTVSDRFKSATYTYTMGVEIVPLSISKSGIGIGKMQSRGTSETGTVDSAGRYYDKTGFLLPVGSIVTYAGSTLPDGYFWCRGGTKNIVDAPDLFAVIGTTYGGDGTTTFQLPNLATRVPVGYDYTGADANFNTMGKKGGETAHTLTVDEMPNHNHAYDTYAGGVAANGTAGQIQRGIQNGTALVKGSVYSTGGNAAHNNLQPYIVLNYIIKY